MKPSGTYKLTNRRASSADATAVPYGREDRIVDSLRLQILAGGPDQSLRLRRIFSTPREIFRLEIDEPGQRYQRMTLLDRDALEELLESDEIRERIVEVST